MRTDLDVIRMIDNLKINESIQKLIMTQNQQILAKFDHSRLIYDQKISNKLNQNKKEIFGIDLLRQKSNVTAVSKYNMNIKEFSQNLLTLQLTAQDMHFIQQVIHNVQKTDDNFVEVESSNIGLAHSFNI